LIPTADGAKPVLLLYEKKHKGLIIEKSPLAPLYQRGVLFLPLVKGGEEGFYNECLLLITSLDKYGKGMI
jgi:hypothetical protein